MSDSKKKHWFFKEIQEGQVVPDSSPEIDFDIDNIPLNLALPREAEQNVKDQALKKNIPVISFKVVELSEENQKNFMKNFFNNLKDYTDTEEMKHRLKEMPKNISKHLVVEDFGTTGLTGIYDNWEKMEKEQNNFYHFMWTMNESTKSGEKGGRRGLGRNVFCLTSYYRLFFALTKRHDDGKKFLMGLSNLGIHRDTSKKKRQGIGHFGSLYTPNGEQKKSIQPIEDEDFIQNFISLFKLNRDDKPGLSIVAPFIKKIDEETIEKNILEDSFLPILLNRIIVKVGNKTFDQDSITKYLAKQKDSSVVLDFCKFALDAKKDENIFTVNSTLSGSESDKVSEESFSKEQYNKIKKLYENNKIITFKVPVSLDKIKEKKKVSTFLKVYLKKREKVTSPGKCVMLRNIMSLSTSVNNHCEDPEDNFIFIDFDEPEMSEFVGDAEDANHSKINPFHPMVNRNYKHAFNLCNTLNKTPKNFLNLLNELDDEEIDFQSLSKFAQLSMSDFKADENKEDDDNKKDEGDTGGDLEELFGYQEPFSMDKISKGISIKGLKPIMHIDKKEFPVDIRIKSAYAVIRGNPFSYYDSIADKEINMENLRIKSKNLNIKEKKNNELIISVKNKDFKVSITGPGDDLAWDVDFCDKELWKQIPKIEKNKAD